MLEFIVYSGIALLFIYVFVALYFFKQLWLTVRPHSLRAVIVKIAAALSWPYIVYQVFTEALE